MDKPSVQISKVDECLTCEDGTKVFNRTPHKITIVRIKPDRPNGKTLDENDYVILKIILPTGPSIRLSSEPQEYLPFYSEMCTVPVRTAQKFSGVIGLPEKENFNIIVSEPVARYIHEHMRDTYKGNVFFPDTGPLSAVRYSQDFGDGRKQGDIMGVMYLNMY